MTTEHVKPTQPPASATWVFGAICAVALLLGGALVLGTEPNTGFSDAASVLVFAGIAAVAIERVIEGFWTIMERYAGKFWPFSDAVARLRDVTEAMNKMIEPTIKAAIEDVEKSQKQVTGAKDVLEKLQATWNAEFADFQKHLPDNRRVEQLATIGFQAASVVKELSAGTRVPAAAAQQAVSGAVDFLATFKDNPAKRAVSVLLGVALGLITAGITGLDLVSAALAEPAATPAGSVVGVFISGAILGLGSSPTHTVITTLTEIRNSRRSQSQAAPTIGGADMHQSVIVQAASAPGVTNDDIAAVARLLERSGVKADTDLLAEVTRAATGSARASGSRVGAAASGQVVVTESEIPRSTGPSTLMLRR